MRLRPPLPTPLRRLRNRLHAATRGQPHQAYHSMVWLSVARSGSTYLCDLLKGCPAINAEPEIFHRKCVFTHEFARVSAMLKQKHGLDFPQPRDLQLVDYVHRHPEQFLADLRSLAEGRYLSFKLFPGHLDPAPLRRLILADRNIAKILFRRAPLTTFISREKALQAKKWEFADTSGVQVELSADAFASYVERTDRWFAHLRHYLEDTGQPYSEMTYEEMVAAPNDAERLQFIIDRLAAVFPQFRDLRGAASVAAGVQRRKQDQTRTLAEKIANYEEFSQGLIQRGLGRHLQTA